MIFLRFGRIGLLILALLWAQMLGLRHGTLHPFAGHSQQTKHFTASQTVKIPPIFGLLSTHEEGVDCQLFDQLTHGDALTPLLQIALSLIPVLVLLQVRHADFLQRWHTQYQARAPPLPC